MTASGSDHTESAIDGDPTELDGRVVDTTTADVVSRSDPAAPASEVGPAQRVRAWLRIKRGSWPDVVLAGVLTLLTFVVHDVGYMFSAPFWNDEGWVAISTKLPLSRLTDVTSVTPIGWTFLLRLVFVGGDERLRAIPLLFSALTVLGAYGYVRSLPWPRLLLGRIAAALAGIAALLAPSALARDDLKQYTADAFITVLTLWLFARLEESWSRRRLVTVGVVVVVGFFFSAAGVFVGAAVFGSEVLFALVRRKWRRAIESAVVGGAAGVLLLGIFLVFYRPQIPPGVNSYWSLYYLPIADGWSASVHYLLTRGRQMASYLGMGPLLVGLLLVIAGVVTLIRLRRIALALAVPILLVEMIALGALKQYPLFDLRTSHFLTIAFAVTAAIGVAGICTALAKVHIGVSATAAVIAVTLFLVNPDVHNAIRSKTIPAEDLRTPTNYIATHQRPGDIIVVGVLSSWGFAYYWKTGTPVIEPVTTNLQKFLTVFPDQPNILVATDRSPAAVDAVMDRAVAAAAKNGPSARIWVIHDHVQLAELKAYETYGQQHGLRSTTIISRRLSLLTPDAG